MADNRPDAVVREPEARASVDALTEGMAEQARLAGHIPPMRLIEEFAQETTRETIARHEDLFRNGVPEVKPAAPAGGSPAKLDNLDEEGAKKIARPLDLERLAEKRGRWVPLEHAAEAALVRARIEFLMTYDKVGNEHVRRFPEWVARLQKVYTETKSLAANLALDDREQQSVAADAVMKLLDESDTTFARDLGPWRHPKNPPRVLAAIGAA
jgi:hypothetical protein